MTTTLVREAERVVPVGTHEMVVLEQGGDVVITWDPADDASLAEAAATFDRLVRQERYQAYSVASAPNESEVIRHFDPEAQHVVLAAPLVGG